jgi:hypothetical protein
MPRPPAATLPAAHARPARPKCRWRRTHLAHALMPAAAWTTARTSGAQRQHRAALRPKPAAAGLLAAGVLATACWESAAASLARHKPLQHAAASCRDVLGRAQHADVPRRSRRQGAGRPEQSAPTGAGHPAPRAASSCACTAAGSSALGACGQQRLQHTAARCCGNRLAGPTVRPPPRSVPGPAPCAASSCGIGRFVAQCRRYAEHAQRPPAACWECAGARMPPHTSSTLLPAAVVYPAGPTCCASCAALQPAAGCGSRSAGFHSNCSTRRRAAQHAEHTQRQLMHGTQHSRAAAAAGAGGLRGECAKRDTMEAPLALTPPPACPPPRSTPSRRPQTGAPISRHTARQLPARATERTTRPATQMPKACTPKGRHAASPANPPHLYDVGARARLALMILLGEELYDGLGQVDLLLLLQRRPHDGEHQHPQVVRHRGVDVRVAAQRAHHVGHAQGAWGVGKGRRAGRRAGASASASGGVQAGTEGGAGGQARGQGGGAAHPPSPGTRRAPPSCPGCAPGPEGRQAGEGRRPVRIPARQQQQQRGAGARRAGPLAPAGH